MPKIGVWSADLDFSPHFRNHPTEVCGKFRNPRACRPFHEKKSQVEALSLSSVVGMARNCRILLFCAALAVGFHGSDGLWLHDFSRSYAIDAGLLSLAVI